MFRFLLNHHQKGVFLRLSLKKLLSDDGLIKIETCQKIKFFTSPRKKYQYLKKTISILIFINKKKYKQKLENIIKFSNILHKNEPT